VSKSRVASSADPHAATACAAASLRGVVGCNDVAEEEGAVEPAEVARDARLARRSRIFDPTDFMAELDLMSETRSAIARSVARRRGTCSGQAGAGLHVSRQLPAREKTQDIPAPRAEKSRRQHCAHRC
jgi:hypothetical protein